MQHFHIFAPDIIGQAGKSVSKISLRSASDLDEWLDEVINILGVEQIYLADSSFGGWLATRYTIYQPHNIARLALLGPNRTLAPMTAEFLFRMYAMQLLPFPRIGESFTEWMGQGYQMNDAFLSQMATRSPVRPNPLALTTVKVISIDYKAGFIQIDDIDANNDTPLLDIKPYTPCTDRVETPGLPTWCSHWPKSMETTKDFDWVGEFNFPVYAD